MFIVNMPPVTMKGIQSEAMIMASNSLTFNHEKNEWVNETRLMSIDLPLDSTIL